MVIENYDIGVRYTPLRRYLLIPVAAHDPALGVTGATSSIGAVVEGTSDSQSRAQMIGQGVTKPLARHGRVVLAIAPTAT